MENNIKKKRLLTPKYDVIFKALFGRKGSEEILGGLLNTLLEEEVSKVSLSENPILLQEYPDEKLGILDVVARINDKEIVDIEIQLNNEYNIEKRLLRYWAKKYNEQLKKGEHYKKLKKTILIALLDFEVSELDSFKDSHTIWTLRELRNISINFFQDIEIHIVEMPKILKHNETEEKLKRWIEFILNPESEGVKMSIKEDKTLGKAYEKLEEISNDEYLREIEDLKWKAISDEANLREGAFEEGKQEGEKIGTEVGRQERNKEIAKKLLKEGMDIKKVSEITELTEEEIKKL